MAIGHFYAGAGTLQTVIGRRRVVAAACAFPHAVAARPAALAPLGPIGPVTMH